MLYSKLHIFQNILFHFSFNLHITRLINNRSLYMFTEFWCVIVKEKSPNISVMTCKKGYFSTQAYLHCWILHKSSKIFQYNCVMRAARALACKTNLNVCLQLTEIVQVMKGKFKLQLLNNGNLWPKNDLTWRARRPKWRRG